MTRHARLIGILGAVIALAVIAPEITVAAEPLARADVVDPADPIGPTVIEALGNDDPGEATESRPLTITGLGTPLNGTARTDGRSVVYDPAGCFTGVNAFTYTVTDGVTSQTGQIIVDVKQPANGPVTDTPQARFIRGSTIGKSVPVKLSWCGVLARQASLKSYRVYQSTNGGTTFATTPIIDSTATSRTRSLKTSTGYAWRVKTTDTKGSDSAFSLATSIRRFQEKSSAIKYSSGWKTSSSSKYSGGKEKFVRKKGARATLTVTGVRQFAIVASKASGRGKFHVYVDGVRVTATPISQKQARTAFRRVLYVGSISGNTSDTHRIQVRTTGKARVDLDAILTMSAKADQTVTFDTPAPTDALYRGPDYGVAATSSAGQPVLLSIPETSWPYCSLDAGEVSFHGAGTCTVSATQLGDGTWNARTITQAVTIARAPLTVTGVTAEDRVYAPGGITALIDASGATIEPAGLYPGDEVTLETSAVTGTFSDANAATGKTVTVSGLALIGASAGNYVIEPVTTTADILKAGQEITFTTTPGFRVKDGPGYTVAATASSTLPVTITVDPGSAGVCAIAGLTVSFPGSGQCVLLGDQAGDTNWNPATTTPQQFSVASTGVAPQTVTFDPVANVTYGAAPVTLTATSDSGLPVSFSSETSSVCTVAGSTLTYRAAGSCTVTARQAGDPVYAPATDVPQTITVAKRTLTVAGATASNKVYNGLTAASLGLGSASLVGTVGTDDVTLGTAGATGTFTPDANAGTGKTVVVSGLTLIGTKAGSYSLTQPTATATITRASLTVTAANKSITYGDAEPAYTFGYGGFVGGETSSVVDTPPTCDAATFTGGAGDWPITCSGGADNNYSFSYVAGTLAVAQKPVTISFTAANRPYDATTDAGISGCSVAVIETGDTVTCSSASATASFATAGADNAKTVIGSGFTLAGADNANYTIIATNTTTANITRASPVCTITGYTVTYDGNPHTATGSCVGVIAEALAAPDLTGTTHTAAGTYPTDPWTFTDVSGNYNDDSGTVADVIGQATQTITFGSLSDKTYGAAPFTVSATASSGLTVSFNSQTPLVCSVSGTTVTILAAGTCTVRATQAGDTDWAAATPVNQGFTVTKATLTVTADARSIAFNDPAPTYTFTYGAFQGTDDAGDITTPPTCTSPYVQGDNAGGYTITCSGGLDDQYSFSFTSGTLAVSKADQTIAFGTLADRPYGDVFTVSATASSGLTVEFNSQTTDVCTVSGTTVTIIETGTCTIRATQPGDGTHAPAPDTDQSLTATTRSITVTAVTDSREANDTTSSTGNPTITAGTLAAGDNGNFSQAFDSAAAGTGKTLTPTGTVTQGATNVTARYAITWDPVSTGEITPAAAATLDVSAATPQTAGVAFDVTVTALDDYGNVATDYTGSVVLTSTALDAMPGTHAFTGGDAGVHAFTVTIAGAGFYTFTGTDDTVGSITGTSPSIEVQ